MQPMQPFRLAPVKVPFPGLFVCLLVLIFTIIPSEIALAAPLAQDGTIYVAETQADCASAPGTCLFDDAEGEALVKAVQNASYQKIAIVGAYRLNQISLPLNRPLTLSGQPNASLTTDSPACDRALIEISAAVTIENLKINAGTACATPGRVVIRVNSSGEVNIRHNTLEGGSTVIEYLDNSGNLLVSGNHISGFETSALRRLGSNGPGSLRMVANNVLGKATTSAVVDCANRGTADHNFWGLRKLPSAMTTNCNAQDAKRLGAEIAKAEVGVQADIFLVTSLPGGPNPEIALSTDTGSIRAYVVNHGRLSTPAFPDISASIGTICSNTYDIFIDTVQDANLLTLTLKYDEACANLMAGALQSLRYCQGTPLKVPLMWLDPSKTYTQGWDRTGDAPFAAAAQPAPSVCDVPNRTVSVQINNSDASHPGLRTDLVFTPFVVALAESEILNFALSYGNERVNVTWSAVQEQAVSGYYVLRSEAEHGNYTRASDLITKDEAINGVYLFREPLALTQGREYWYKLEMMGNGGETIMSTLPLSIVVGAAADASPYPAVTNTFPSGSGAYPAYTPFPTVAFSTPQPAQGGMALTQTAYYQALTVTPTQLTPVPITSTPSDFIPTATPTLLPDSVTLTPFPTPTATQVYVAAPLVPGVWLLKYGQNQLRYWWALPAGTLVSLLLILVAGAFISRKK